MTELITVADLVRKCQQEGVPTDEAILLIERASVGGFPAGHAGRGGLTL